jgi:hypothetical protein
MIRIEVIANRSVEENILEALRDEGAGKYYTKYPNVFGVGRSGPRMGDAIWPEENFALVFWCEYEEALEIERAVAYVKEHFPDEGIKIFGLPEHESMFRAVPVEPPVKQYNSFQAEIKPHTAADRFAAPNAYGTVADPPAARAESGDSFPKKAVNQDTFKEEAAGVGPSHHPGETAETGGSTVIPADEDDDWLGRRNLEEPSHAPASDPDASEQEALPTREEPPQTGYDDEWRRPQPEERAQTPSPPRLSPDPEPDQTPAWPFSGNSGMEDENF